MAEKKSVSMQDIADEPVSYTHLDVYKRQILLTKGKDGSCAYYKEMRIEKKGFCVQAIETTGAGDTFCGCSLGYLLEHDLQHLSEKELEAVSYTHLGWTACSRRSDRMSEKRSSSRRCERI